MAINVWLDMLAGRLASYINAALEDEVHFDLMTLMRRVFANKTLMNYKLIMEQAFDAVDGKEVMDRDEFDAKIMRKSFPRVVKAFQSLPTAVTVDDMRTSSYRINDVPAYSFMQGFWVFLLKVAYGGAEDLGTEFFYEALFETGRQHAISAGVDRESFMLIASDDPLPLYVTELKDDQVDMIEMLLQDTEQKLLSVKNKSINGSMDTLDAAKSPTVH
jgi:hypothetical protein